MYFYSRNYSQVKITQLNLKFSNNYDKYYESFLKEFKLCYISGVITLAVC